MRLIDLWRWTELGIVWSGADCFQAESSPINWQLTRNCTVVSNASCPSQLVKSNTWIGQMNQRYLVKIINLMFILSLNWNPSIFISENVAQDVYEKNIISLRKKNGLSVNPPIHITLTSVSRCLTIASASFGNIRNQVSFRTNNGFNHKTIGIFMNLNKLDESE